MRPTGGGRKAPSISWPAYPSRDPVPSFVGVEISSSKINLEVIVLEQPCGLEPTLLLNYVISRPITQVNASAGVTWLTWAWAMVGYHSESRILSDEQA